MHNSPFKIYNASAGSGKTYTLTKEYLKIILSAPKSYKQILAITFTNKAVSEMKHRILGSLYDFGNVNNFKEAPDMFLAIAKELNINPPLLKQKSQTTLKDILHNYAFFDISTIDKFTHRLLRTFAKDLKLPQNFEVVLDNDLLLTEAVSRLIDKVGIDKQLTKVLTEFALEKIDDNKSWDIAFDLIQIGKLLFNENHSRHLQKLINKDIDSFLELKKTIVTSTKSLKQEITSAALEALQLIETNGLEFGDFNRSYFPKFMLKISSGDKIDFVAGWKQNFESNLLYTKTCPDTTKTTLDGLHPQFIVLFNTIKDSQQNFNFLKNIYSNIIPLTVLNAIQQEIKKLQQDRSQLSISEFNTIISNEIRNQPAPFIYERLGEKYSHYFIDEFQDTSVMQWHNLIPLIDNALSSDKGSLFLVGDVKQAIYRWRGGKAAQFLNLINQETNPFVATPSIASLPKNYRSYQEIVNFNNTFFTHVSPFLKNETYNTLFKEGNQQEHKAVEGGTVQITLVEKQSDNDLNQTYCEEVLTTIKTILEKQYQLRDIIILVRDNKHGIVLAEFLNQQGIPIISPDSLLISSSEKVLFLINILRLSILPEDLEISYTILTFLANSQENKHTFINTHLSAITSFLNQNYAFDLEKLKQSSVYDGLEYAIKQFKLAETSDAYLTYLMDAVFEVEQKDGTGIQLFLSYWDRKKEKLNVTAPENVDAIQIMSIHKAKGLEFPIVIFPFANANIYKEINPKLWLPLDPKSFNGFDEILINKKREVVDYNPKAAQLYNEENNMLELDAFNVLYVALTRAIKGLFIITEKALDKAGKHNTNYYSGLFINYLKEKKLWDIQKSTYSFGELGDSTYKKSHEKEEYINYQYTFKERPSFKIIAKTGILWDTERGTALSKGNLIHHVMSHIETEKDIPRALDIVQQNGDNTSDEIVSFKNYSK